MIGGCASGGRPYEPATYVVRPEDTLYSIAWRHNLDYRTIAKWNNIGTDYRVSIGQVLVLQSPAEPRAPRASSRASEAAAQNAAPMTSQAATSVDVRNQRAGNVPSVGKPVPLADPPAGVAYPSGRQRSTAATPNGAGAPSAAATMGAAPASNDGHSKWVWPTDRLSA